MVDFTEERARIARELHDGIAQDLAALGYALDAEIGRSDTSDSSRKALRTLREQVTNLNAKVRAEIFTLRSEKSPTIDEQLQEALKTLGISVEVSGALPEGAIAEELRKVIIELVRNAKEHG